MSIQNEITRIQTARNTLRAKAAELGLVQSTAKLDEVAAAFEEVENQGAVSATVQEGDTYTIPKGYHNGSGTVSGVAGGGNYNLQSKSTTPTKKQQSITPDGGYYGLSDVTVAAIPDIYQDVSSVTATAGDVLANKVFVTSGGAVTPGTMPNNGAVTKTLDTSTTGYTIPAGYHSGGGSVKLVTEEKSVTPTKSSQTVTPTTGKVLAKVTVGAIPSEYITTGDATAVAANLLLGKTAYADGVKLTGTMPDNGAVNESFDGLTATSCSIPAGYTSGGIVRLTGDIEDALAAI